MEQLEDTGWVTACLFLTIHLTTYQRRKGGKLGLYRS